MIRKIMIRLLSPSWIRNGKALASQAGISKPDYILGAWAGAFAPKIVLGALGKGLKKKKKKWTGGALFVTPPPLNEMWTA